MDTVEVVATPESDAKALSDRELAEANYVMLRKVEKFTTQLAGLMDSMMSDMKDNPMFAMLMGKKKR